MLVRPVAVVPAAAGSPAAPLVPYVLGSEVGVPTGTSLASRTSLGSANGGTETYTLNDPRGVLSQSSVSVSVWEDIEFTGTITANVPSGQHWLFRRCRFLNSSDNWCVEVNPLGSTALMNPAVVFEDCAFDGDDSCGRALLGGGTWLVRCHLSNAEDAWGGPYDSVVIDSNLIATTDGQTDPHQDGLQIAGIGNVIAWQTYFECLDPEASSAFRVGTESSAVDLIDLRYCTFSGGAYSLQVRGDSGAGDITGVTVEHCRWTGSAPKGLAAFGPTDFVEATVSSWADNRFIGDDSVIGSPV